MFNPDKNPRLANFAPGRRERKSSSDAISVQGQRKTFLEVATGRISQSAMVCARHFVVLHCAMMFHLGERFENMSLDIDYGSKDRNDCLIWSIVIALQTDIDRNFFRGRLCDSLSEFCIDQLSSLAYNNNVRFEETDDREGLIARMTSYLKGPNPICINIFAASFHKICADLGEMNTGILIGKVCTEKNSRGKNFKCVKPQSYLKPFVDNGNCKAICVVLNENETHWMIARDNITQETKTKRFHDIGKAISTY